MEVEKGCRLVKLGAWVLVVAGFGHAIAAIPDLFLSGLFSPTAENALLPLREVSLNIVELAKGNGTSLLESAWGAYIGFTIAIGILLGFFGLLLLLLAKHDGELFVRVKSLLPALIAMSAIMVAVSLTFFFYLPAILIAFSLVCFILAWSSYRQVTG